MSAEHAEPPRLHKPAGSVECVVGGCGNTAGTKVMFKFPAKGQRRESWCRALDIDPVGRSRLLKGAVVCQDHFVLEEDCDNYMYTRFMGGKMKLKKSAVPSIAISSQHTTDSVSVNNVARDFIMEQAETTNNIDKSTPDPAMMPKQNDSGSVELNCVENQISTKQEGTKCDDDEPAPCLVVSPEQNINVPVAVNGEENEIPSKQEETKRDDESACLPCPMVSPKLNTSDSVAINNVEEDFIMKQAGIAMNIDKSAVPDPAVMPKQNINGPVAVNGEEKEIPSKQEETKRDNEESAPYPMVSPKQNINSPVAVNGAEKKFSTKQEGTKRDDDESAPCPVVSPKHNTSDSVAINNVEKDFIIEQAGNAMNIDKSAVPDPAVMPKQNINGPVAVNVVETEISTKQEGTKRDDDKSAPFPVVSPKQNINSPVAVNGADKKFSTKQEETKRDDKSAPCPVVLPKQNRRKYKKEISMNKKGTKPTDGVLSTSIIRKMNPHVNLVRLSAKDIFNALYPSGTCGELSKSRIIGMDKPQPKLAPFDRNAMEDTNIEEATISNFTPPKVTEKMVSRPNAKPLIVTPPKITLNMDCGPRTCPLEIIQPDALPVEPKFTCHHCNLTFVTFDALRTHTSKHLELLRSKARSRKNKFCCVPVCYKSSEGNPDTLFFRAPRSLEKWLKWSEIFGIINVDYTQCKHTRFVVCQDHFYEKDLIVKGETVRLKKNALPKKPIALQIKPRLKSNSGITLEEMKNIDVMNVNESENQKPKRVRKKVKKPLPVVEKSATANGSPEKETSAGSSTKVLGTPGGELKLDVVRRLVKLTSPGERIKGSVIEKRIVVPVVELLRKGLAHIVSDKPKESKMVLPVSQSLKQGCPTRRIVQIKLPAGTRIPDQMKLVHTVGSSGWTEANRQIIEGTKKGLPTDEDIADTKKMANEVNIQSKHDELIEKETPPHNASGKMLERQQIASPSATKLVRAGRNMILVRTKPEKPKPTPEKNTDIVPATSTDLKDPEKYCPNPKSMREREPVRPALKVNKGITEVRFKLESSDTTPAKHEPDNSFVSIAKPIWENPQPPLLSTPKNKPKRVRNILSRKTKIENGTVSDMSTSISKHFQTPTKTPPSVNTATPAQNIETEALNYRPGRKSVKRKAEVEIQTKMGTSSPTQKLISPTNSASLVFKTPIARSVLPATKRKRQMTKLSNEVNPQSLESSPFATPHQLILINTSYPPSTESPKMKPAEVKLAAKPNPYPQMKPSKYCHSSKLMKNVQPNQVPSLPAPALCNPTIVAAQGIEFTRPKSKSILGKRRRTMSKIVHPLAPTIKQHASTLHNILKPNERVDAEGCHIPEPKLETTESSFIPTYDKPTTRHSTGKLTKSRIFDDFETEEPPRSPTRNTKSADSSPLKNTLSANSSLLKNMGHANESTLGAKTGACRASTSHLPTSQSTFLTPSPPPKRIKLIKNPGATLFDRHYPWNDDAKNSHKSTRILTLSRISRNEIRQSRGGEFTCVHCCENFHTQPQLKLHTIIRGSSCTLQASSLEHSKSETFLQKMPTNENAIKKCFDIVNPTGVKPASSFICEDVFEDRFSVVKEEDVKPAYIRDWIQHPVDPPLIRFSGLTPGFKPAEFGSSPFDYFLHFVTPEFLEETCAATNENIEKVVSKLQPEDGPVALLTLEELLSFLAIVLLHFTVLGGIAEWLGDYGLPVGSCMTSDRFKFLLQALSFSQSSPLLKYFNERMRDISNPPKQLLLSDSAIVQNDTLVYARFFDHSPYQGILYNLSGQDGMVHRICLKKEAVCPAGRNDFPNPVVSSLMDGLLDKGYSLYMNNFYCSVQLAEDLLEWKTYCTGTVRNTRIIAPPEIHRAMPEQLLVMGKSTLTATSYYTSDGICFTKWDEGREILCVSTEFGANMVGNDEFVRPKMYRNYMEMTNIKGAPPMPRLALMWGNADVKLTLQVLAILIRNAYILYSNDRQTISSNPSITLDDFHFEVARHLLVYPTTVTISPYLLSHLPSLIEGTRHTSVLMPRKMCEECRERATVIFCKTCPGAPSLCHSCYRRHHEQISILIFKKPQKA